MNNDTTTTVIAKPRAALWRNPWFAFGLLSVVLLTFAASPLLPRSYPERPFDPIDWRFGTIRQRGAMAHDLVDSKRLVGLDAAGVEALLGSPDFGREYEVDLGYVFGGSPWTYHLWIRYGDDGKVTEADLRD